MKIAIITDQHLGVRADSTIFHEYFSRFYKDCFFPILKKEGIDTILNLGDIFDRRKYINFDTLDRSRLYFFDELQKRNLKFIGVVGNHDVYFKNSNRINSPNLLLQEYQNCVFYTEPTEISIGNLNFLMLPWINNENYKDSMSAVESSNADIVCAHLELKGFEMHRGAMNEHGLSHKLFSKFDMVLTGHFHHKSTKDNIHYLGSPYEMTWSDYNDDKGFHILDTDTMELTFIKNPYRIFHKVVYDDNSSDDILNHDYSHIENCYVKVIVKNKDNPYVFDLFIDKLNSYNPTQLQIVEDNLNLDINNEEDLVNEAEDTVTIIQKYINNLELKDSKKIENLFYELYNDALSVD